MIHYARILLVCVGLLKIIGFSAGWKWMEGIGSVLVASPLPIVFTEQKGVETFAHEFHLEYRDRDGKKMVLPITPALYGQFDAPYNYRNVIGAAISYGPVMPEKLWKPILHYSFVEPGEISSSMGLRTPLREASVKLRTKTKGRDDSWELVIVPEDKDE
jgi:hypothetical protein